MLGFADNPYGDTPARANSVCAANPRHRRSRCFLDQYGSCVCLALLWALAGTTRVYGFSSSPNHAWHWVTVFAPQVLLVVPALLWARSIQAVFRRGVAVSGTVTRQRVGLYGLLVIEFSYLAEGRECRNSNHFVPLAPSKLLKPGTAIEVLLSDSRFPGPLVRDAYWYGNGGAT
jgi:hypothetical protein